MKNRFINLFTALAVSAGLATSVSAATLEVGVGKTYAKIMEANIVAAAGDTILVFSGVYDENLWLDRAVTIREADGETAVVRSVPGVATGAGQAHWMDVTAAGIVWENIDVVQNATDRTMRVWTSGTGSITFRGVTFSDTSAATGVIPYGFLANGSDGFTLENCQLLDTHATYDQVIHIEGNGKGTLINTEVACKSNIGAYVNENIASGISGSLTINGSTFTKPAATGGEQIHLVAGDVIINDSEFTISPTGSRIILIPGATANADLTVNRTRFNLTGSSYAGDINAVQLAAGGSVAPARFTNCLFLADLLNGANGNGSAIDANGGGVIVLNNNTFVARTANAGNRGVRGPSSGAGSPVLNLTANNNIFYLPGAQGSDGGAVLNLGFGTINVTAGTNLVFTNGGTGLTADALTGTILDFDPLFRSDFLHIDPNSPAIDAGVANGVTDDIDNQTRTGNPDLGADEYVFVPTSTKHWIHY